MTPMSYDPSIKIVGIMPEIKMQAADLQFDRLRQKYERAVRMQFRRIFREEKARLLEIEPDIKTISEVVEASKPSMDRTLRWLYHGLASDIYPMVKEDMDGKAYAHHIERKWLEVFDSEDVYAIQMEDWIRRYSMSRVTYISDSTMRGLRELLDASTSVADFQNKVTIRYGMSDARASRIARTETCGGSNAASLEAVKSMDSARQQMKTWRCITDRVTRDTHQHMDGVCIPIEEKFTWFGPAGYVTMDHPGDSTYGAPAAEVVNCRCRMHFHAEKR